MEQKEKELLLRDLSARLPYEVIVNIEYSKEHGSSYRLKICSEGDLKLNTDLLGLFIQEEIYLKPYLRPMSSMTEEEKKEFESLGWRIDEFDNNHPWAHIGDIDHVLTGIDWLNAHHFDFRGLIEKGLALRAPTGMYN